MFLRLAYVAPLALAAVLPAQLKPVKPGLLQGTPAITAPAPKPLTAAEQLEQLKKDKARLEREIQYASQRVDSAKQLLTAKMRRAKPSFKVIDAGKPASNTPLAPQPVQRKYARVGSPDDMDFGGQPMMIKVNDRAISQANFDRVMGYLRETSTAQGKDNLLAQRALFDMIRIEAVASQFIENPGEVQMVENREKILSGKMSIKQAASKFGSVQGAIEGTVTIGRNSIYGPSFEQVAFSTPVGKTSAPFRTMNGFAMLHVKEYVKGEVSPQDKVTIDVVEFSYTEDPQTLATAKFKINSGQTDVIVRDQGVMDMLPALFKPPAPRTTARAQLTKQLSQLMKQYKENLKANPQRAAAIQSQIEQIQKRLSDMERQRMSDQQPGDARPDSDDAGAGQKRKVAPLKKGKVAPLKKGKVAPLKAPIKKDGE